MKIAPSKSYEFRENRSSVPRKGAVLLIFLLSLLPRWSGAAFVPAGKSARVPTTAAIPENLSNEVFDSLTSALLSPDVSGSPSPAAMDKIGLIGQNLANMNLMEDLRLDEIDRTLGISANERLYTAALVVWVGVTQRRAGRESYKAELVNKIASEDLSTEEVRNSLLSAVLI